MVKGDSHKMGTGRTSHLLTHTRDFTESPVGGCPVWCGTEGC